MSAIRSTRVYLTKEAAVRAQLVKMAADPDYRPGDYEPGLDGIVEAKRNLEDLRETLRDYKGEGDS